MCVFTLCAAMATEWGERETTWACCHWVRKYIHMYMYTHLLLCVCMGHVHCLSTILFSHDDGSVCLWLCYHGELRVEQCLYMQY